MIVTVYAISKNEEKFVSRWAKSMREADYVVVLDTGSVDGTVEALRKEGVTVKSAEIVPWRFDKARNESLKLVPPETDVCVCTDLDEVFEEGWREKLEKSWTQNTKQGRYRYVWSHLDSGEAGVEFYIEKMHVLKGFRWVNPVHEILAYSGRDYSSVTIKDVTLHHYPDDKKSRSSYLPLLELAVKENPENDRNMHYLGREYMFYRMYDKAIDTLTGHLALPSATWADERAASMRYIARCRLALNQTALAECWFLRAIAEAPNVREAYVEYSRLLYDRKDWHGVIFFLNKALEIKNRSVSYINVPQSWGALPYDLISLAYYFTYDYDNALRFVDEAIKLSDEKRLKENRRFFEEAKNGRKNL